MTDTIDDLLGDARILGRLQRWDEAIDKLRSGLDKASDDPRLERMLAGILIAAGRFDEGAAVYMRLLDRDPTDGEIVRQAADVLWALDRHDDALRILRRIPDLLDRNELALPLGRVLVALGRSEEALPHLRRARAMDGDNANFTEAWRWLVQASAADRSECRRLLADADPNTCHDASAAQAIATFANDFGERAVAETWCRRALVLDSSYGPAWFVYGIVLSGLRKRQEAYDALMQACRLLPESDEILMAVAGAAIEADRVNDARPAVERLAQRANASCDELLIAGLALWQLGEGDRALASFMRASELGPADGAIEDAAIGNLYETIAADRLAPLIERLRAKAKSNDTALRLFAYRSLYLADWRDREAMAARYSQTLDAWVDGGKADCNMLWTLAGLGLDYATDLRVCRSIASRYAVAVEPMPERKPRDKIRVGWLQISTEFHSTPMAALNLVSRCDRARFEVFGYARRDQLRPAGHVNHEFQNKLRSAFDVFRDLSTLDGHQAATAMRADDLDVLIELQGLNENNSLDVVARRPARVTAVYYGFSHSTGADYFDYLIADRVFLPPALAGIGSEKIVYVPGCHMAPTLGEIGDTRFSRAVLGLPEDALVLANFNNPWKHDPKSFRSWMRILAAVPEAVLWLAKWNDTSVKNLRNEARQAGIDPGRLVFGPVAGHRDHLARLQTADLALNSFFVGGGVTSLDTLWAGVPMVATRGMANAPSAYLGASMLDAAGLGELVVDTPEAYEALVVALCRDRGRLAGLRAHLVEGRKTLPLFDIDGAARHVDRACELMFENWAAGRSPRDLEVEPMWSREQ